MIFFKENSSILETCKRICKKFSWTNEKETRQLSLYFYRLCMYSSSKKSGDKNHFNLHYMYFTEHISYNLITRPIEGNIKYRSK